jgi:response regulator RpfG family c-di-GMP phosphodiesterase
MNKARASVVVVDDEIYIQEILRATLEKAGYDCVAVGDAQSALEQFAAREFDAAFIDIILPGISGKELLQIIHEKHPHTVVVVITAMDGAATAIEMIHLGAYDYIVKPFNLEQVAISANRALEKRRLEAANREYQKYLEEVAEERSAETRRLFYSMTQVLIGLLELKVPFKPGHLKTIADMSRYVARELRVTEAGVRKVYLAALLHDVGMISVEEGLLAKPSPLTEEEAHRVKVHTAVAETVLKPIVTDEEVIKCIRHHHERFDGSGYPDGLKGNHIPLGARIIAVVEAFVAMTRGRPYRPAKSPGEAIAELRRCTNTQFDEQVVTVFAELYPQVFRNLENAPPGLP